MHDEVSVEEAAARTGAVISAIIAQFRGCGCGKETKMRSEPATRTASLAGRPAAPHRREAMVHAVPNAFVRKRPPFDQRFLRTRVRSECFHRRPVLLLEEDSFAGRNARAPQRMCVWFPIPADHPRELPATIGSLTLYRASRHLTHALTALCSRLLFRATGKWLDGVKKLWTPTVRCGKERKSGKESSEY